MPRPENPIATDVEPPRTKRTESDEPQALRALRKYREIEERLSAAELRYKESCAALNAEKLALTQTLSPAVTKLVDAMRLATATSGGEP